MPNIIVVIFPFNKNLIWCLTRNSKAMAYAVPRTTMPWKLASNLISRAKH